MMIRIHSFAVYIVTMDEIRDEVSSSRRVANFSLQNSGRDTRDIVKLIYQERNRFTCQGRKYQDENVLQVTWNFRRKP